MKEQSISPSPPVLEREFRQSTRDLSNDKQALLNTFARKVTKKNPVTITFSDIELSSFS